MDFYRIECFLAAAETGSMTKAAEKMCVTQPAISFQIRELERELQITIRISKEPMLGGIQAAIPAKNIVIDHSFASMLAEEQEAFVFDGGYTHA